MYPASDKLNKHKKSIADLYVGHVSCRLHVETRRQQYVKPTASEAAVEKIGGKCDMKYL